MAEREKQLRRAVASEVERELERQRKVARQDSIRRAALELRLRRFRGADADYQAAVYIQALWKGRLEREEMWYDGLYG
eukprot:6598673-Prymnesium_polylepis.1